MVPPALALFFVFHTIPVLQGIYYSFTDSPGYGPSNLVGLRNYIALFPTPACSTRTGSRSCRRRGDDPGERHLPGHRRGPQRQDQVQDPLRGVYFIPNVLAILVVGYIFNYLFRNSLPALGEKLGIDFLSSRC